MCMYASVYIFSLCVELCLQVFLLTHSVRVYIVFVCSIVCANISSPLLSIGGTIVFPWCARTHTLSLSCNTTQYYTHK